MVHSLRPVLEIKTPNLLYFSYVHSVLNYGIMFWGNSLYSKSVFITQKGIVRNNMKAKPKDSCKELFSKLGNLTLYSQYIFSTLAFVVKHTDLSELNIQFHSINTCHKLDLHMQTGNCTKQHT
jgi:hypothetical protein